MTNVLKAIAVAVGVIGSVIVSVAMLLGPLIDEPAPDVIERFVIFAYPICLFLGGIFVLLRTRIGLVYGVLAIVFAAAWVAIHLTGDNNWNSLGEKLIYPIIVVGPGVILASLCWSILREESRPPIPTRLNRR